MVTGLSSGIIRNGVLKMKLSFASDVCVSDRQKILHDWAVGMTKSEVTILEMQHYQTMSCVVAKISHTHTTVKC
mgnify:CR=1 FL=1